MTSSTPPRPWWQPGPFDYSAIEMLIMRLLFAMMIFHLIKWETAPYTTQKFPHGIAHFVDLTWLAAHPLGTFWQALTALGLVIYSIGFVPVAALLPALVIAILTGTLVTSQSQNVNHTWQLGTLILLAQFIVYAWPKPRSELLRPTLTVHRLAIYASTVVFAASYVVCGLVKLVNSNFQWIQKAPLLAVQLLKSNWANYYSSLQPVPPWLDRTTQAIVDHPHLARLFFGGGLVIELTAFIILIDRRFAFWGGLAIIAMHLSISKIMNLDFEYHIAAAVIFLVNVPGVLLRPRSILGRA